MAKSLTPDEFTVLRALQDAQTETINSASALCGLPGNQVQQALQTLVERGYAFVYDHSGLKFGRTSAGRAAVIATIERNTPAIG